MVNIGFSNHLVNLVIRQFFTYIGHVMIQLLSSYPPITIVIEDFEPISKFFFFFIIIIYVVHLFRHQSNKFIEIDGAVAVYVVIIDHVQKIIVGGVLAEGIHDNFDLFGSYGFITVRIKG